MSFSFGFEIEGIVTELIGPSTSLPPNDPWVTELISPSTSLPPSGSWEPRRDIIVGALRAGNINARTMSSNYAAWQVDREVTIDVNLPFDRIIYNVDQQSIQTTDISEDKYGFEIKSPVYGDLASDTWKQETQLVMESLGQAVEWGVNQSTGLHVHIGLGLDRGKPKSFSLDHLKKVAIFCCRFEAVLDKFHPAHRSFQTNQYIRSNRKNIKLVQKTDTEAYRLIQMAQSLGDLCNVVNPEAKGIAARFYKVNFTNFVKHPRVPRTIEFRQHAGTTDPQVIVKWVRFLCKFVEYAIKHDYEALANGGNRRADLEELIGPIDYQSLWK